MQKIKLVNDSKQPDEYTLMCLGAPNTVVLKKVNPFFRHTETLRSFDAPLTVFDFDLHASGHYALVLSEIGRIFVFQ